MIKYPALFIVTSLHKTLWFSVDENHNLQKINEYAGEKVSFEDHEGSFESSGKGATTRLGEPDIMNEERKNQQKIYLKEIIEDTENIIKQNNFGYIMYATPERIKNDMAEKMEHILKTTENKYVPGNFTKMPEEDLRNIFIKNLKVYKE